MLGYEDSDFVDTRELSALERVLFDFGNEMQQGLQKELGKNNDYGRSTMESGDLFRDIDFSTEILGSLFTFKLKMSDYYDYVNKGVRGSDKKKNINYTSDYKFKSKSIKMTNSLKTWARSRQLNPFAVARSIAQKGTEANGFYDKVVTPERLKRLQRDLSKASAEDVQVLVTATARGIIGIAK